MPRLTVPANATPGDLINGIIAGPPLCKDLDEAGWGTAGWVEIVIRPVGLVRPDAWGRYLHPIFKFAAPTIDGGRRRGAVENWPLTTLNPQFAQVTELAVECDPGTYWIGSWVMVYFGGGTPGDEYDVYASYVTPRNARELQTDVFEPPFRFELTSYFLITGELTYVNIPGIPDHHTYLYVAQGNAQVVVAGGGGAAIPLAALGYDGRIGTNVPGIQVATSVIRTGGGF